MSDAPTIDIPAYCRIHARRMEEEGFTKTALVLEWAAAEIERLKADTQAKQEAQMDAIQNETRADILVHVADAFVVVTRRRDTFFPPIPPPKYRYVYDHCDTLAEAQEMQRDYENGEYEPWEYVDTFPVRRGMPFSPPLVTQLGAA